MAMGNRPRRRFNRLAALP